MSQSQLYLLQIALLAPLQIDHLRNLVRNHKFYNLLDEAFQKIDLLIIFFAKATVLPFLLGLPFINNVVIPFSPYLPHFIPIKMIFQQSLPKVQLF